MSEETEIEDPKERDGIATVEVTLPVSDVLKRVGLILAMVIDKSANGMLSSWRTEKVGFGNLEEDLIWTMVINKSANRVLSL